MVLSKKKVLLSLDKIIIATLFVFVAASIFSISITQIAAGLGGLAWAIKTHLNHTWKEQKWPLVIPILLFALACLIAVVDAYDVSYSFPPLKKLLEFIIFFWVINCVKTRKLRDSLSLVLIVSATCASLLGFYQAWMGGVQVESRVEGTLSTYMTFAGILMMVSLLAISRTLYISPKETWLWPCIGIILTSLLFTLTRQAWGGVFVGLLFFLFFSKKKYVLVLLLSLFVAIFYFKKEVQSELLELEIELRLTPNKSFIAWDHLLLRTRLLLSGEDQTLMMRIALWKAGWEVFKDYPLTGCGFRCMDKLVSKYPDPTGWVERLRGMHNNFVQLALDTGFLGLFTWVGIWFCFFLLLYQRAKALNGDANERWVVLGSAAGVIAFLAAGLFETNFYDSEVAMTLYFLMALPFSASQKGSRKDVSSPAYSGKQYFAF
jgi:O-antigen ligase